MPDSAVGTCIHATLWEYLFNCTLLEEAIARGCRVLCLSFMTALGFVLTIRAAKSL